MDNKQFEENLKIYNHLNSYLVILLREGRDEEKIAKDIISLSDEIESIRMRLFGSSDFPYTYCEVDFREEYNVELPKYGMEEFNRNLKGRMYFTILGGSESGKFMYLKTKSFAEAFKLKITYKSLEINDRQNGKANLIYDNRYSGPETKVFYTIKKLR
jgi:hypothetical protein